MAFQRIRGKNTTNKSKSSVPIALLVRQGLEISDNTCRCRQMIRLDVNIKLSEQQFIIHRIEFGFSEDDTIDGMEPNQ